MCLSDGMVDVSDSKSDGGDTVWVQVPPQAPVTNLFELFELLDKYQSEMIDFFVFRKNHRKDGKWYYKSEKKDFEYNHEAINNLNKRINEQSEEIKLLKQDLNNKEDIIGENDN